MKDPVFYFRLLFVKVVLKTLCLLSECSTDSTVQHSTRGLTPATDQPSSVLSLFCSLTTTPMSAKGKIFIFQVKKTVKCLMIVR